MKIGIKFILIYYGLSILFLFISGQFVKGLTGETLSYLLWFYIYNIVLGIIFFPIVLLMISKLNMKDLWKSLICFLTILILLNVVPFFANNGQIITIDALKELFSKDRKGFNFNISGIHLIAIISFVIASMIFERKFFAYHGNDRV